MAVMIGDKSRSHALTRLAKSSRPARLVSFQPPPLLIQVHDLTVSALS